MDGGLKAQNDSEDPDDESNQKSEQERAKSVGSSKYSLFQILTDKNFWPRRQTEESQIPKVVQLNQDIEEPMMPHFDGFKMASNESKVQDSSKKSIKSVQFSI